MTCEVAVMNKRGIALAADSAVTLLGESKKNEGKKVYHTAEKLFPLSPSVPVAIMTFGAADMMGIPWETIVKIYAQKLGSHRFETLEQYAKDFLNFIEAATTLFPPDEQKYCVEGVVHAIWSVLYRDKLTEKMTEAPNASNRDTTAALLDIIRKDHEDWAKYPDLEGLGLDYGAHVVKTYASVIDEVEAKVFEGITLPPEIRQDLRETVRFMFGKEWFHPADESGVVIAGLGEDEPFPALLCYRICTVAACRLRYTKADESRVRRHDDEAIVVPFGQSDTIEMIISGVHPTIKSKLIDEVGRLLPNAGEIEKAPDADRIERLKEDVEKYISDESERYDRPLMAAVSALPRQDLAKVAEALVSLTAFLKRMAADQDETVAEPIDVAILSKGDGFIWVKHKDLIRQAEGLAL